MSNLSYKEECIKIYKDKKQAQEEEQKQRLKKNLERSKQLFIIQVKSRFEIDCQEKDIKIGTKQNDDKILVLEHEGVKIASNIATTDRCDLAFFLIKECGKCKGTYFANNIYSKESIGQALLGEDREFHDTTMCYGCEREQGELERKEINDDYDNTYRDKLREFAKILREIMDY